MKDDMVKGMQHAKGREMQTKLQSDRQKVTGHLGTIGIDSSIILKWSLRKWSVTLWTGFKCLRIQFSGGLLNMLKDISLHKRRRIP
jgi:hypothetical protein